MMRIIRCIRIDKNIWEDTRNAVIEDKTYISHLIEALLRSYLLERAIAMASYTLKGTIYEHDAKPGNKS